MPWRGERRRPTSQLEDTLAAQIHQADLPAPERQFKFHPSRRWRMDFVWPAHMIALEVQGGTWSRGAHTRGRGYERDCEKHNAARLLGWRVYTVTGDMVRDGRALATVAEALGYTPYSPRVA